MTAEINPIERSVDSFLEGLDEPLETIRELLAKTDAEFIDDTGRFSLDNKMANYMAIGAAIRDFNDIVYKRDIQTIARVSGASPTSAAALAYETARSIKLNSWRNGDPRSRNDEPLPIIPESVGGARQILLDTVENVEIIVDWWSSPNPYFIEYKQSNDGDNVTIFPSRGTNNVKVDRGDKSFNQNPSIYTSFKGGRRVTLKGKDGDLTWIDLAGENNEKFSWPLLGYHNQHAAPEDFLGSAYNNFTFAGGESADLVVTTNAQRFAARVALSALIAGSEEDLPKIELPAPNDEFSESVVDLLATSTINAFLPPRMIGSVRHSNRSAGGSNVYVRAMPNIIQSSSEVEIRMYLRAVGAGVLDLVDATSRTFGKMHASTLLGGRIDAIKAQDSVDTFFGSLMSGKS